MKKKIKNKMDGIQNNETRSLPVEAVLKAFHGLTVYEVFETLCEVKRRISKAKEEELSRLKETAEKLNEEFKIINQPI